MFVSKKTRSLIGFNPTGDLGPFTIYTSKRMGTVWFTKSPPLEPASERQTHYRNRFRFAARAWKLLTPDERENWNEACRRCHLYMCGYCLFVWYQLKRDRPTLATIERIAGISLAD